MALSCGLGSHFQSPSFRELLLHTIEVPQAAEAEHTQDVRSDFPHESTMYTLSTAQQDVVLVPAELFDIVQHAWLPIWMKSSLFLVFFMVEAH